MRGRRRSDAGSDARRWQLPTDPRQRRRCAGDGCRPALRAALATRPPTPLRLPLVGSGDGDAVDGAAVDALRRRSPVAPSTAAVVSGEGEKDDAPMLHLGERSARVTGRRSTSPSTRSTGRGSPRRARPARWRSSRSAPRGAFVDLGPAHYLDKLVHAGADVGLELDAPVAETPRPARRGTGRTPSPTCVSPCRTGRGTPTSPPRSRAAGARLHAFEHGDIERVRARRGIRWRARPAARHRRCAGGRARGRRSCGRTAA